MIEDRCARHPRFATSSCPFCEALIARAELLRDDPGDDDELEAAEARYERWLGGET